MQLSDARAGLRSCVYYISYVHTNIYQGKPLATPYARAVLSMLPQTPFDGTNIAFHESINDITVHKATLPQVFHPISESRHFSRADAGETFEKGLLPPEKRIPHPQAVAIEKDRLEGTIFEERNSKNWEAADARDRALEKVAARRREKEVKATTIVQSGRWNFKFRDVVVDRESVGRHVPGVGSRYGVPPQDRKKGQVKIPTRVG